MTPHIRTTPKFIPRNLLPYLRVLFCVLLWVLFSWTTSLNSVAQTAAPQASPSQGTVGRIDQLFTECRQLVGSGNFGQVEAKGLEALALSRSINDKSRQSRALSYVALGAYHAGRIEEAIEPFKESAALAGAAGDVRQQFLALNSGGVLLQEAGRLEEALDFFNQSLDLCRKQPERRCESGILRNIGGVLIRAHEYDRAERVIQLSLKLARDHKLDVLEYGALMLLAQLENARGDYAQALRYIDLTVKFESTTGSAAAKYSARISKGVAARELGQYELAAQALKEALETARSQKIPIAEAEALNDIADLQLHQSKWSEAYSTAGEALLLFRRAGANAFQEAEALYVLARAQRELGKVDEALAGLRLAMSLFERNRPFALPTESAKAGLLSEQSEIFVAAIDILVSQGKGTEALTVSEQLHGRAFLDSLAEARADLNRVLPKNLLQKEDSLLTRITTIQKELWQESTSAERTKQLTTELTSAEDALAQFQIEVRSSDPAYASLKYPVPFTGERVQRELLNDETGLIEFVVGEEKSYAWFVSREKITQAVLPSRAELNRLVGAYRKSLSESAPGPGVADSITKLRVEGRELYKVLLQPFENRFGSLKKLIIVPDNVLSYLPFETLVASSARGRSNYYLLERFAITYAPSAAALAAVLATKRPNSTRAVFALGDPNYERFSENQAKQSVNSPAESLDEVRGARGLDFRKLPYTRTEVSNISGIFSSTGSTVLLGAEANEQTLKSQKLSDYRYVHFAAHGLVDEQNPGRSGVVLSLSEPNRDDGILQVTEIMKLKLDADLVTLSACRTGLGRIVRGEGVLGLTRAFMYAGARTVVASLWNVNDSATAELMKVFYQNLKRGLTKDEALRQAKIQMLKGSHRSWRHPYYWAPFVLAGANN
jgi:CHAT domain-containing protein/tetratricopeptide (TPR) repeat protein